MTHSLILGHSGFIGHRLFSSFREHHPGSTVEGYSLDDFDLADPSGASELASLIRPNTTLLFLAGIKKQRGDTLETFDRNIAMAVNACRAIARTPASRIVFFSSAEVYGESTNDTGITEMTPVCPTSYYGSAKLASEVILRRAADATDASLLILRPPLVYGPGETYPVYGPSGFAKAVAQAEPVILWGDGSEQREFLFVDDLVNVVRLLTFSHASGVVNVCSGRTATFREVVDTISTIAGVLPHIESRPRTRPAVNQGYRNDRLHQLLPDFVFTPIRDGLQELIDCHHPNRA